MPIKLKQSEKVRNKQTGKVITEHFYIKCASKKDLVALLDNEYTKPKVKQKVRNELTKRGMTLYDAKEVKNEMF
jgi:hypothetical protein